MGKMKEIYMKMVEEEYQGDHDAYIQDLARVKIEEVIEESYDVVVDKVCPNCFERSKLHSMVQKGTEVECLDCGQAFDEVEPGVLRFK